MIMAAVSAWGFTVARALAHHSRLRTESACTQEEMREEIRHLQEEAARARNHAAQIASDAATWAAGCKQGRDDVIAVLPMLIAARNGPASPCTPHAAEEETEHA
jgi:hypothetical protein